MKKLFFIILLLANSLISYSSLCTKNHFLEIIEYLYYEDKLEEQQIKAGKSENLEDYRLVLFYTTKLEELIDHLITNHSREIEQQIDIFYKKQSLIRELKATINFYIIHQENNLKYGN